MNVHRFHFHASEKIIYAPLQGIGKPQAMCVLSSCLNKKCHSSTFFPKTYSFVSGCLARHQNYRHIELKELASPPLQHQNKESQKFQGILELVRGLATQVMIWHTAISYTPEDERMFPEKGPF